VDRAAADDWIRAHVKPVGAIETAHERPWATVLRVPLANGVAWFKACAPVQAFEPRLTAGHRVEALGGRLGVESPQGGGTNVMAELPCD
jgi:hypothetical protein